MIGPAPGDRGVVGGVFVDDSHLFVVGSLRSGADGYSCWGAVGLRGS